MCGSLNAAWLHLSVKRSLRPDIKFDFIPHNVWVTQCNMATSVSTKVNI